MKNRTSRIRLCAALTALLLCASLTGCSRPTLLGQTAPADDGPTSPAVNAPASADPAQNTDPAPTPGAAAPTPVFTPASDYDAVLRLMRSYQDEIKSTGRMVTDFALDDSIARVESADEATAATVNAAAKGDNSDGSAAELGDYDGTNVQTAGIDEGDVVKTDGRWLYVMDEQGGVRILEAAGADTRTVGMIEGTDQSWSSNIYVVGDRLVRLCNVYRYDDATAERKFYKEPTHATAEIFDVSDRSAPVLLTALAQDGWVNDSRLLDGVLYLVSTNYSYANSFVEGDAFADGDAMPEARALMPCTYRDGAETPLSADCILLPEEPVGTAFTVVTAIDVAAGEHIAERAMLGAAGTVYMSGDSLILGMTRGVTDESEPYEKGHYRVVDYESRNETTLLRLLTDGTLTPAASTAVTGSLLDPFALNEYDGHLRLVLTDRRSRWSVYNDDEFDFHNTVWDEDGNTSVCTLRILDGQFAEVGAIEELAADEQVYAVRFDGGIGYCVTFRQVDPLFAIDVSDPTAPRVLSALKIPGFSEYLHPWGDGLLFGFGQHTEEQEGGWTTTAGLKLSMFDVSDPADVREKHTLVLDQNWSEALYNYKAILVLPERGLIGFPAENSYLLYQYDENGFALSRELSLGEFWIDGGRCVRIGETLYVCARTGVQVIALGDFSRLASVAF